MEWNNGMEQWNGTMEWTDGMERWNGKMEWKNGTPATIVKVQLELVPWNCGRNMEKWNGGMEQWNGTMEWKNGMEKWNTCN